MSQEVISALIAVGGVLVSVLVSVVFGIISNRYNYNQLFAQTISNNRMDWINVWRENVSKFLACAEFLHKHNSSCSAQCKNSQICEKCCEYEKEMYQAKSMIVSRLNLTEKLHALMKASIDNIEINDDDQTFTAKCEYILEVARQILKLEWERLKDEARGKRRK